MDIKQAAFFLLILRIISSVALCWVIYRQIGYLRQNNPPEEQKIRYALTALTCILLAGNIIPIIVDVVTLYNPHIRQNQTLAPIGVAYTFSNASFAAIAGMGWAFFYWLADREKVVLRKENKDLHEEVDQLHHDAEDTKQKQDAKDARTAAKNRKKA